ncbi:hypothetical protein ACFLUY_03470 [Chloroflexota bacterium]
MTVTLACPEDNGPLSYDKLDKEWRKWYEANYRQYSESWLSSPLRQTTIKNMEVIQAFSKA